MRTGKIEREIVIGLALLLLIVWWFNRGNNNVRNGNGGINGGSQCGQPCGGYHSGLAPCPEGCVCEPPPANLPDAQTTCIPA